MKTLNDQLMQRLRELEEKDARRRALKAAAMRKWRKRRRESAAR